MGKKILIAAFVIQFIGLIVFSLYFGGYKKYGSPRAFYAKKTAAARALQDSLRRLEMEELHPENAGDSTMYDLGRHINIFEKTDEYEKRIATLQTALDSLKKEIDTLKRLEAIVSNKEQLLKMIQDQTSSTNIGNLAKMFDAMKVQQAVPVVVEIPDTLAVKILTRMQSRNSANLLSAIAQTDTLKAVRLTNLLARMGTLGEK